MSSDQEARGMLYADMENIRNILTFGDENCLRIFKKTLNVFNSRLDNVQEIINGLNT